MKRTSSALRGEVDVGSPAPRSRSQERQQKNDGRTMNPSTNGVDSERVGYATDVSHKRAFSDPFDSNDDMVKQIFANGDGSAVPASNSADALPTLPRFPVSATRDLNCFSEPPINIFHVRGPNYLDDKVKISSGPYLLRARGCDLFLSEHAPNDIGR